MVGRRLIKGVVLAGGKSKRMGSDKAVLSLGDKTWGEVALNRFRELGIDSALSVNSEQAVKWKSLFPETTMVVDSMDAAGGPLRGILSAHKAFPQNDLFVTACDLPMITADLMRTLLADYQNHTSSYDYFAYSKDDVEPLCAIYRYEALASLHSALSDGSLTQHCPRKIIKGGRTRILDLPADHRQQLNNFNTAADIAEFLS